jgi:plastocyanin
MRTLPARMARLAAPALALVLALTAAGCGDDDEGVSADSPDEPAACTPVGEEVAAGAARTVDVDLQEFSFSPSTLETAAGVTTFAARNVGVENHELAFLPGGGEVPLTAAGEPDEDALGAAGAFELEAFGPDQTCNATYDLRPGTYTLFCIVTGDDGNTHYEKGMRGQLTVR